MRKILYIDDEQDNLFTFQINLKKWFKPLTTDNPLEALEIIEREKIKVIVTDQRMPKMTGLELAKQIKEHFPTVIIIILTAYDDNETIIKAINQGGIFRYLLKPWDLRDLKQTLENAFAVYDLKKNNISYINDLLSKNRKLQAAYNEINSLKEKLEEENIQLKDEFSDKLLSTEIIGKSTLMQNIFKQVKLAAKSESSILLLGETGTGKELFAKAIHAESNRHKKIMVKLNCAAMPESLIESELFGHEKGAFTGADKLKYGKFEIANEGTLFLDEIGELPLHVQPKLLRVLQENEFERLGSNTVRQTDFRLITATNRNLEEEIEKGTFRNDLFYRLNVLPISIPPLRMHKEDISLLAHFFLDRMNRKSGKIIKTISKKIIEKLISYDWPGNIRELENIIERAHVLSTGTSLELGDWFSSTNKNTKKSQLVLSLSENERQHIQKALKMTKWRIRGLNGAAELLQINPTTLESRMKKLGIERPK